MPTVTDEDVLELVERFDIPLEDTVEVERLQKSLADKLAAAGVDYVSTDFLSRFQRGLELKYAALPEAEVSFKSYFRAPTRRYPSGYWQSVYTDIPSGRFISRETVMKRVEGLQL